MPRQVTGVNVIDNANDTVTVEVGPYGFTRDKSLLFDRTPSEDHIRHNLRMAFMIGGYAEIASREFITAVNKGGSGMEGRDGKVKIDDIWLEDADTGVYRVEFTYRDGRTFGIPTNKEELTTDWNDPEIVVGNLVPFLRVGGRNQLNAAATNAIRNASFWY